MAQVSIEILREWVDGLQGADRNLTELAQKVLDAFDMLSERVEMLEGTEQG